MVIGMRVFYLDSFFALNVILDYLLLILTARLSGVFVNQIRALLAALMGSFFAVWMFFFKGETWLRLVFGIGFAWILISIAFYGIRIMKRVRLAGVFCMEAFVFSGVMLLLQNLNFGRITVQNGITYIQLEFWQITLSAIGGYFLMEVCFRDHSLKLEKQRLRFRAELKDSCVDSLLLIDSGNLLREPLSGKSVILLAPELVENLLPGDVKGWFDTNNWDVLSLMAFLVEHNIVARVLPIHTAGAGECLTLVFKVDQLLLEVNGMLKETTDYWIGIARNDIDVCGGCRGLIGI